VVHTPTELFGRKGLDDEDWLPEVGRNGWVIFGRDQHILDRELELRAYLAAGVHMFLLPGEATREQLTDLLAANLRAICATANARRVGVYWLTPRGLVSYERRRADRERQRKRSR
jgi:PIN like domain